MFSFLLVCLSLLLLSSVSAGETTINTLEIHTSSDLITFSNSVNSGTSYSGTTVFLTSDIYFDEGTSNHFYPIGNTSNKWFSGIFDGQGYTINNLKITQGSNYTFGLFGYSNKGIFKNVVLGSSCEVICQVNNAVYVSSIIGACNSNSATSCFISNSVNMASVSFNGTNYGPPLYMGGIAGQAHEVNNCANYGTISFNKLVNSYAYIGGIVGYSSKSDITNCINYGVLFHDGISGTLCLGGITGQSSSRVTITNCVNMGQIMISGTANKSSLVGNIVGELANNTITFNCYWDDSIDYNFSGFQGINIAISNVISFNTNTLGLNESVTTEEYTGKSLIYALNAFVKTNNNLSLWASNTNEKSVSFFINNRTTPLLISNTKVILLPSLSNNTFHGWFTDKCFSKSFNGNSITDGIMTLYGKYGDFISEERCDTSSSSSSSSTTTTSNILSSSSLSLKYSISSSSTSSSSSEFPSEYVQITFSSKVLTKKK